MGNALGFWYLLQPLFHYAKGHGIALRCGSARQLYVVSWKSQIWCQRWPKTDRCRHFCWVSLDTSYDILGPYVWN